MGVACPSPYSLRPPQLPCLYFSLQILYPYAQSFSAVRLSWIDITAAGNSRLSLYPLLPLITVPVAGCSQSEILSLDFHKGRLTGSASLCKKFPTAPLARLVGDKLLCKKECEAGRQVPRRHLPWLSPGIFQKKMQSQRLNCSVPRCIQKGSLFPFSNSTGDGCRGHTGTSNGIDGPSEKSFLSLFPCVHIKRSNYHIMSSGQTSSLL